jgi:hypothetical protein
MLKPISVKRFERGCFDRCDVLRVGKLYKSGTKEYRKEKMRILRNHVLTVMGGKCCKCGFSDYRALQIDHADGMGFAERKFRQTTGYSYLKKVEKSFKSRAGKYQLLCANCNWIKKHEENNVFGVSFITDSYGNYIKI